ncbi:MAG: PIN domain-containing protein [Candidatus Bathyarchaeales archaeon]
METHRVRDNALMANKNKRKKAKVKVILDSNALFAPLQFKIDIFEELRNLLKANIEPILLSSVRRELGKLAEHGAPNMRKKAAYALRLAENCKLVERSGDFISPDDDIVEFASKWKIPVFTNDRILRRRLRNISVPVIYVRQKSRLEIDGRI